MNDTIEEEARRLLADLMIPPNSVAGIRIASAIRAAGRAGMRREREAVVQFCAAHPRVSGDIIAEDVRDGFHHPGGDPLKE